MKWNKLMDKIKNEIDQKLSIFYLSDVGSIRFSTVENMYSAIQNSEMEEKKFHKFEIFSKSKIPKYENQYNSQPIDPIELKFGLQVLSTF